MPDQKKECQNNISSGKFKDDQLKYLAELNQINSQRGTVQPNNSPHFDKTSIEGSSLRSAPSADNLETARNPICSLQSNMSFYPGPSKVSFPQPQFMPNSLSQNQNSVLMRDGRICQMDQYKSSQEGIYSGYSIGYNNCNFSAMKPNAQIINRQSEANMYSLNEETINNGNKMSSMYHDQLELLRKGTICPRNNQNTSQEKNTPRDDKENVKKGCPKRKKVSKACVYCRRSHMTCNDERPCSRCVIRNIGHLCHDQDSPGASGTNPGSGVVSPKEKQRTSISYSAFPYSFASEHMDNEYKVISNFLKSLDGAENQFHPSNRAETFLLTAADPSDGTYEERLHEIITAKYRAGLLKPYNYVNGYSRLQKYMDVNMSPTSQQRILNALSTFRPKFQQIAKSLTDFDLVLVEEGFERILLDYDRVFSSMGIPACLWRRTGEIFKGNKEFAALIGIPYDQLKEGKVCVYELMTEDSAVSYWDKYGNIAFDQQQKAMLSSCSLKNRRPNSDPHPISCCFSFTIRRDKYNIPIAIVGNFLPIHPSSQ